MSTKPDNERIAVVETEVETHGSQISELTLAVKGMSKELQNIALQLAGNKGFIAGMSVTLAGVGSVIGAVFALIADHFMRPK